MSVSIEEVTVASETEKRLVLGNAMWAAQMSIGTDWATIHIGLRVAFDTAGVSFSGTPRFTIGVMNTPTAGLTNGMLNPVAGTHFWGIRSNSSTWVHDNGKWEWTRNEGLAFMSQEGVTATNRATNLFSTGDFLSADKDNKRSVIILALRKSGGNMQGGLVIPLGTTLVNKTLAELKAGVGATTMTGASTAVGNSQFDEDLGTSYAFDEATYGDLNTIHVAWDQLAPTCHISEIVYAKHA